MDVTAEQEAAHRARLFLVSVGVSLFRSGNRAAEGEGEDLEKRMLCCTDSDGAGTPGAIRGTDLRAGILERLLASEGDRNISAEVDTLLRLETPPTSGDEVRLIAPENELANLAAGILAEFIQVRTRASTSVVAISGLQLGDPRRLELHGLPELVRSLAAALSGSMAGEKYVVVTAGYKPVSTYLTILGLVFGCSVVYHVQGEGQPLRLPAIEISLDLELWKKHRLLFNQLGWRGALPAEEVRRRAPDAWRGPLSPYLVREGDSVLLSALGQLLHENAGRSPAIYDGLTGLHSRGFLHSVLEVPPRMWTRLASIFIDLDHFGTINKDRGHRAGDAVLKEASRRIRRHLRANGPEDSIAARYGGEEFVIMMPEVSSDELDRIAEGIRITLAHDPIILENGEPVTVTASIGGASTDGGERLSPRELLERAEEAMRRAKRGGRNRVVIRPA